MKLFTFSLLLFLAFICPAQKEDSARYQLLWEISGNGQTAPSYLFGTMHVTDSRVFNMPDSVLLAIQNTQGFALEIDFDSASYSFLEYMYAAHGDALFDDETWKKGMQSWDGPANEKPKIDPADLFKLLEHNEEKKEESTFLDAFLFRIARQNHKTITGLEGIVEQLSLLTSPTPEISVSSEKEGKGPVAKRPRLEEMITAYAAGDLEQVHQMVNKGSTSSFFKEEVIIRRNLGMAHRADSLIRKRPTFIGVGAAHLLGDQGVISLLRQSGYHLRPVIASYSGLNQLLREAPYEPVWQQFRRASDGYQLKVPARPFAMDILDGKVKMYLGMDFAGGIVYCFYAFPLPGEIDALAREKVGKSVLKSFGKSIVAGNEPIDFTYKSMAAKEYSVKKDGEYMRIRLLFDKHKMYMLLLGNSQQVIQAPFADEWFNSLETFDPVALTKQTAYPVTDHRNGFSLRFPGEPDYATHQQATFLTGEEGAVYNIYELKDVANQQRMTMLIEDFVDSYEMGILENRMPDFALYFSSDSIQTPTSRKTLRVDGVRGLEWKYETSHGSVCRIQCFTRGNRLFVMGMEMAANDPDSQVVDEVFSSLHFLARNQPTLEYVQKIGPSMTVNFPGKPIKWDQAQVSQEMLGNIDSMQVYLHHDPNSGFNTLVNIGHIWKYYGGTIEALLKKGESPSAIVVTQSPSELSDVTSANITIMSLDSTMVDHQRRLVVGQNLILLRIQVSKDAAGEAKAAEYFQLFQSGIAENTRKFGPKLQQILDDCTSSDTLRQLDGLLGIELYDLQPSEYELAISKVLSFQDTLDFSLDDQILERLLEKNDSTLLDRLKQLYHTLPQSSSLRRSIILNLLNQSWPSSNSWAISQLHDDLNLLQFESNSFLWFSYLQADSQLTKLASLDFLLDKPQYALDLAASAAQLALNNEIKDNRYVSKFEKIMQAAIDNFPNGLNWMMELSMEQLLQYLTWQESPQWRNLAHQCLALKGSYLAGSAFVLLAEKGIKPTKKELKMVMESKESRSTAFIWVLDNGMTNELPKRYRDPDFIALVAFDNSLEESADLVELVEKRKIYYDGSWQWLYVYKFAMEGESEWLLGFSGPIPMKGYPQNSYFSLGGSNWETYHPSSYKRRVKAWIKEMEAAEN